MKSLNLWIGAPKKATPCVACQGVHGATSPQTHQPAIADGGQTIQGSILVTRTRKGSAALACLLLIAAAGRAHAQDALLDGASALLDRHEPEAAFRLLAPEETGRAGEPRYDYLLGISALDAGHLSRAIFALERAVAVRPEDGTARAELARAYLAAGEVDKGRETLEQVRRGPLPGAVGSAIDRVLGAIDQAAPARRLAWSGYLEAGTGFDTNVNSATNQGDFAIPAFGGIVFSNGPESRRQSDLFAQVAGGALGQYALDPAWKLIAALNARSTVNRRVHDMNTDLADASLGLGHAAGADVQTLAVQNNTAWVGGGVYRSATGASAQWQHQLDARSQASVFAQWSRQAYPGQTERNTDRAVLGLGYARELQAIGTLAYASAYLVDERARQGDAANYGQHGIGWRVGAERKLGSGGVAFAEWLHEHRHYGGAEPLFGVGRDDRQDDLTVGVRLAVAPAWQLVPQVRYTRAASNVVLYDYVRTVYQISLRREFP